MNQDYITPEKFYELEKQYKLLKIRDKEKTKSIKELESEIGNKNNMLHKKDGDITHLKKLLNKRNNNLDERKFNQHYNKSFRQNYYNVTKPCKWEIIKVGNCTFGKNCTYIHDKWIHTQCSYNKDNTVCAQYINRKNSKWCQNHFTTMENSKKSSDNNGI